MLKDIFIKKNKDSTNEKILKSIADGYVDIKAYKHFEDGSKKLVYHDTGDNTVTNWMRHAIMLMLSGYSLSNDGKKSFNSSTSQVDNEQITKPSSEYHTDDTNADGYCLNGSQYLWSSTELKGYPVSSNNDLYNDPETYAIFPTKILLGTGCEYTDWASLKEENEEDNATWYANMVKQYGDGDEDLAAKNFNMLTGITESTDTTESQNYTCNVYSGTIGIQGVYSGNGTIQKSVNVNDPDTTTNISTSADMANRYGVVGAIKTLYLPKEGDEFSKKIIESTVSDSGRLLQGKYRGAGRPCFVYFNRTKIDSSNGELDWDKQVSDIYVSKDTSTDFLNRITFRVVIPAQSSGTGQVGTYNPFNGYTFKQVGLFNDVLFSTRSAKNADSIARRNMPCGMMLAVKNIQNFSKTADTSIEFTWTLTI